jgi:hypothetical protein
LTQAIKQRGAGQLMMRYRLWKWLPWLALLPSV